MRSTDVIGGFFELGMPVGELPYPDTYPVNLGRNGLLLIIRERQYTEMWLPAYICQDVVEILRSKKVKINFYEINEKLEPAAIPVLKKNEAFLYVNYFGIKDTACEKISKKIENVILDLSQAFFYTPPERIDAFNSARKFIGVPDGGFVFGNLARKLTLPQGFSHDQIKHLALRADGLIEDGYQAYKKRESNLNKLPPLKMSLLSQCLIRSIDKKKVVSKRTKNFKILHNYLHQENELHTGLNNSSPLCYPLLVKNGKKLKEKLISKSIFVPTYWPGVNIEPDFKFERKLMEHLVCLPVDQRYDESHMMKMVEAING
jgi:hypothetical protein